MDFAGRLIYTLPLNPNRVANPAEVRTLRRDLGGNEEYGARTMSALTPMRPRKETPKTVRAF